MTHSKSGEFRKTKRPFYRLVGAVSNCAYSAVANRTYRGRKCLFILAHIKKECKAGGEGPLRTPLSPPASRGRVTPNKLGGNYLRPCCTNSLHEPLFFESTIVLTNRVLC